MLKRIFDIFLSILVLVCCLPFLIIISLLIIIDSGFPVIYKQTRVGKDKKEFMIFKFRTMYRNVPSNGFLTVGARDVRITRIGYILRKYKLDELPQLFNIIKGDMSLVGPRPETPNFVKLYDQEQIKVLTVNPGLTDYASLEYMNENELLSEYSDPIDAYIKYVMPAKLLLNIKYIKEKSFSTDIKILLRTVFKILR